MAAAAFAAAALVAGGFACSGCGYDEKKPIVIFDGGKNVITVGDFVYHYKRAVEMAPPQSKPVVNTYDDAKGFLDDLINSRVLEMEADRLGYGKDPELAAAIADFRSNLLREKTQKKIRDGVTVTEAEILDYYNKNKEWRMVSFIMCDKGASRPGLRGARRRYGLERRRQNLFRIRPQQGPGRRYAGGFHVYRR